MLIAQSFLMLLSNCAMHQAICQICFDVRLPTWDQKRAMQTIQTIERHWYQTDGAGTGPRTDAQEGPDDEDEGSDDEEGPPCKQLKASVNDVCAHVACSAQTVCLVEQMQIVRDNYRGRIDQFRIKVSTLSITYAAEHP